VSGDNTLYVTTDVRDAFALSHHAEQQW